MSSGDIYYSQDNFFLHTYAFLLALASARLSFSAAITLSTSPRDESIAEIPICLITRRTGLSVSRTIDLEQSRCVRTRCGSISL